MEYFIFLPDSPGAGERWWFCALCSELSTEGPWPRRVGVPGAKAAVEFGHCSPRVKFSKPCLVSEVPDRAGVSASPCSEALLVPPWERIPWDHWYPLGTGTLWAEEQQCHGRGRTCLGSGGFLQLTVASSKSCVKSDPWAHFCAGSCPGKEQSWFIGGFWSCHWQIHQFSTAWASVLCWDCLSWDSSSDSSKGNLLGHSAEGILPPHLHLALGQLHG